MEWWQQLLVAFVGGGTVGAVVSPWVHGAVEKSRQRFERRRQLVDDGWATVRYVRANARASPSPSRVRIGEPRPAATPVVHDLMKQNSVLLLLGELTDSEREAIEENYLVDLDRRAGLDALEVALRRLTRKWRLS